MSGFNLSGDWDNIKKVFQEFVLSIVVALFIAAAFYLLFMGLASLGEFFHG